MSGAGTGKKPPEKDPGINAPQKRVPPRKVPWENIPGKTLEEINPLDK